MITLKQLKLEITSFITVFIAALLLMSSQLVLAQNSNANENAQANGNGQNKGKNNIGFGNASDGIKGKIKTNKDIVYTGEPLEIGFHFARGSDLINGEVPQADAYIVIFTPVTAPAPLPPEEPAADDTTTTETTTDTTSTDTTTTETTTTETTTETTSTDTTVDTLVSDAIVVPVSEEAGVEGFQLFMIPAVDLSTLTAGTYQLGLILTVPGGNPLIINDWYNGLLGLVDVSGLTISAEALEADADGDGMMDCGGDGLTCPEDTATDGSSDGSGDGTVDTTTDSTEPTPPPS